MGKETSGRYRKNEEAIKNVGLNIRKYRKLKKLTIVKLAYATNIQPKAIHNYEHGLVDTNITILTLIADAVGIEAYQLLMKYEEVKPQAPE